MRHLGTKKRRIKLQHRCVKIPIRRETPGPLGYLCVCGKVHTKLPAHKQKDIAKLVRLRISLMEAICTNITYLI